MRILALLCVLIFVVGCEGETASVPTTDAEPSAEASPTAGDSEGTSADETTEQGSDEHQLRPRD